MDKGAHGNPGDDVEAILKADLSKVGVEDGDLEAKADLIISFMQDVSRAALEAAEKRGMSLQSLTLVPRVREIDRDGKYLELITSGYFGDEDDSDQAAFNELKVLIDAVRVTAGRMEIPADLLIGSILGKKVRLATEPPAAGPRRPSHARGRPRRHG